MENSIYSTLTRQSGLLREMQTVANNIANLSTTGFRAEGVVFAEHVRTLGAGEESLSMASANGRRIALEQGGTINTGSEFDFAIEGNGFFMIETSAGNRLTRAGHFTPNENGELVTPDGLRVLDDGGAPVIIPSDANLVTLAGDGTLSADGTPVAVIGVWQPLDTSQLRHQGGVVFEATGGVALAENTVLMQGFLEESNVNPVSEIARMIQVQRAYELGQGFLDKEDERVRGFIRTVGARS